MIGALSPAEQEALCHALLDLEQTARRLRHRLQRLRVQPRDLTSEIEDALKTRPPITTPEIAQTIRSRESDVRRILRQNPHRFQIAPRVPGRSGQAKCWILASQAPPTQPEASADSHGEARG